MIVPPTLDVPRVVVSPPSYDCTPVLVGLSQLGILTKVFYGYEVITQNDGAEEPNGSRQEDPNQEDPNTIAGRQSVNGDE